MRADQLQSWARVAVRVALSVAFLSAVSDRLGLYGPFGSTGVSWGDWAHFVASTGRLTWFLPPPLVSVSAFVATALEVIFAVALLAGYQIRLAALGSAALLTLFGLAMAFGLDFSAPLDYSVFTAAAAAFLLGVTADDASARV